MRVVRACLLLPALVLTLVSLSIVSEAAAPRGGVSGSQSASTATDPVLYRYKIDNLRSRISFTFRGLMIPFDAHFAVMEGEIYLGPGGKFRGAKAEIVVQSDSVKTKDRSQLASLRNQVLEVRRFPRIRLRVDAGNSEGDPVEHRREREWRVKARGKLLMHGVEREIPLRFRLTDTGAEIYVRGEGALDLFRFDMSPPSVLLLVPSSNRVTVRVRIVAEPVPR